MTRIGVIGGSGLYAIDGLQDEEWVTVQTPWGEPSDQILTGRVGDKQVAFLPRHGRGHRHSPTSINYRANIDALKRLGVTDVISVSACGSFREEMAPGDFVLVDQFITCARLRGALADAAAAIGVRAHLGGTYLTMEGPQFSTLAESRMYREHWGADVIGMTNMPEAKLAREAELCYTTIAMVTDYDSWHPDHGEVNITSILATMHANVVHARSLLERVITMLPGDRAGERAPCPHGCDRALEFAVMTAPDKRDPALLAKLEAVAGRVLG
jgi:5'-methylthioadenosine phosphorylase